MKLARRFGLVGIALVLLAGGANASVPPQFEFGLTGGFDYPSETGRFVGALGMFDQRLDTANGASVGVFGDLWSHDGVVAVGVDLTLTHFSSDDLILYNSSGQFDYVSNIESSPLFIAVHLKWAPTQARPFWVEAGVGEAAVQSRYYSLYVDRCAPVQSVGGASYRETTSPFGFRLGAGAKLWDNGAGVRLDVVGRYQWLDAAALRVGSAGPAGFADVGLSLAFGRPRAREN